MKPSTRSVVENIGLVTVCAATLFWLFKPLHERRIARIAQWEKTFVRASGGGDVNVTHYSFTGCDWYWSFNLGEDVSADITINGQVSKLRICRNMGEPFQATMSTTTTIRKVLTP